MRRFDFHDLQDHLSWVLPHWISANTAALVITLVLSSFIFLRHETKRFNAPIQGYKSAWEPTVLLKSRFTLGARDIIKRAYSLMKDKPFVLLRYDVDFMVLPVKYLEEIRLVKESKLSARGAQVGVRNPSTHIDPLTDCRRTDLRAVLKNLEPKWTGVDFLLHSYLHVNMLKNKLIPELWKYVDMARDELVYGWELELPAADDEWVEVNLEYAMRRLVARITAAVFMGHPACRDPEWLKISIDFSIDMFKTAFSLKMFPPWLYPIAIHLIPYRWRSRRQLHQAQKIVGDLMRKHDEAVKSGTEEEDILLHWQLDHASPSERELPEMAARQCILTLASIHTTAMNVGNMIYDLCANPEWFAPMTEEVDNVFRSLTTPGNKWGEATAANITSKEWCSGLQKLDSFFVESQRLNPVILLNPQRLAREDITFKDGTTVPKGARVAFPMYDHHMDPTLFPEPEKFDPMRSYRKRHASPDQMHLHMAGQTSPTNLGFGYGNQACSGRQFAVAEIKLIMGRLLHEYEFKFPDGKERPKVMYINENVFTDQSATVMMRRRKS